MGRNVKSSRGVSSASGSGSSSSASPPSAASALSAGGSASTSSTVTPQLSNLHTTMDGGFGEMPPPSPTSAVALRLPQESLTSAAAASAAGPLLLPRSVRASSPSSPLRRQRSRVEADDNDDAGEYALVSTKGGANAAVVSDDDEEDASYTQDPETDAAQYSTDLYEEEPADGMDDDVETEMLYQAIRAGPPAEAGEEATFFEPRSWQHDPYAWNPFAPGTIAVDTLTTTTAISVQEQQQRQEEEADRHYYPIAPAARLDTPPAADSIVGQLDAAALSNTAAIFSNHHHYHDQAIPSINPSPAAQRQLQQQQQRGAASVRPLVMCCYLKQGKLCKMGDACWYSHIGEPHTPCHYGTACKAGHRHLAIAAASTTTEQQHQAAVPHHYPSHSSNVALPAEYGTTASPHHWQHPSSPHQHHHAEHHHSLPPAFFAEQPAAALHHHHQHQQQAYMPPPPPSPMESAVAAPYIPGPLAPTKRAVPAAPSVESDVPCQFCGAESVRLQMFPVYRGKVREMKIRGHCAVCLATFMVEKPTSQDAAAAAQAQSQEF